MGGCANQPVETLLGAVREVLNTSPIEVSRMIIALSHYYYKHPCGDMIADPDMEMRVAHKSEFVEALAYQDGFVYQRVYCNENEEHPKLKENLNNFLGQWLKNCLVQGHKLKIEIKEYR